MHHPFRITIDRDERAGVWVAVSQDVPGLATEAADLATLDMRLSRLIPDLLDANGLTVRAPLRWQYLFRVNG